MTERRKILSYEENNVHTGWRRYYCYLQRAGATAKVKRQTNPRERREGKRDVDKRLREAP